MSVKRRSFFFTSIPLEGIGIYTPKGIVVSVDKN